MTGRQRRRHKTNGNVNSRAVDNGMNRDAGVCSRNGNIGSGKAGQRDNRDVAKSDGHKNKRNAGSGKVEQRDKREAGIGNRKGNAGSGTCGKQKLLFERFFVLIIQWNLF